MPVQPSQSPNLLNQSPKRVEAVAEKYHLTLSAVSKIIILLTQTIFLILLGINSKTVTDVGRLESEVRALETQLISKQLSVIQIENMIKKIEMLKTLEATGTEFSARSEKAIELVPSQVVLSQATIKADSMVIVIETDTPLDAALLINTYFSQDLADQITLNNANLSTTTGKFITNMEVRFK